jgi:mannose-6-phosphate isomerase-like protein (cupin superfamily)
MSLNPQHSYMHLSTEGLAETVPGGAGFWSFPERELARFGQGWLIAAFEFRDDWTNWEMHPQADEFVYLLAGSAELLLELPGETKRVRLDGRGAVVVPRGVWHTARVHKPSRMLHVTKGAGTQHRPVERDD